MDGMNFFQPQMTLKINTGTNTNKRTQVIFSPNHINKIPAAIATGTSEIAVTAIRGIFIITKMTEETTSNGANAAKPKPLARII